MTRPPYRVDDPLDLDWNFDADALAIRDTVRRWCHDNVTDHIARWFDSGTIPARDLARELGELGVLGMHLDGYGCAGATATAYGLVCLELDACDSGLRSLVSVQGSLAMYAIWRFGSEEHKQQWLPKMATGEAIGCFGLTEPDSGSDPAALRTFARRDGTDWVLSGSKMWITNGSIADVAVVWAATDDGISGFVVPTDTPGFSATTLERKMSMRASVTSQLSFDEVRLPAEAILPHAKGVKGALSCLNEARYGICWGAVGAARSSLEIARDYAVTRVQFQRPIAAFQLTQQKLVDMTVSVGNGTLLAAHLGHLKDAGRARPEHISHGKLHNVRSAIEVCRTARTVLGANGISLDYHVIRHANNLESVRTYEGTDEMHTLILGNAITGISAFGKPTDA